MTDSRGVLDDRPFMDALLDVVIPAGPSGDIPSAGSLSLVPAVAAGLRADPLLGPMVEAGLESLRQAALARNPGGLASMTPPETVEFAQEQLAAQPFVVMGLLRYLYPAYYQHPRVLTGIGEVARPPFPEGFEVEPTAPDLMEKLRTRQTHPRTPPG